MYFFELEQPPISKARARHARRGSGVVTYDPQREQVKADKLWFEHEMRQKGYLKLADEPLMIELRFGITKTKKMQQRRLKREFEYVVVKPDIDNFIKYYLDVMNGIVFSDDKIVSIVHASKVYSDRPLVQICVSKCCDLS